MKEIFKPIATELLLNHGIDISLYDDSFIAKTIQNRCVATHCVTIDTYLENLVKDKTDIEQLLVNFQNNFSDFFRNQLTFSVLEQCVIPQLLHNPKKELRIWSAACACGQEPYSMAILCTELAQRWNNEWTFRIFATDKNATVLHEAQKGVYNSSLITNLKLKHLQQWFSKKGEKYQIHDSLKNAIDFSEFDLLNEQYSCPPASIFGNFDIVLCSNILFYYKPKYQKKILEKISKSIHPKGYIIVGEAERNILLDMGYIEEFAMSAIFRKR